MRKDNLHSPAPPVLFICLFVYLFWLKGIKTTEFGGTAVIETYFKSLSVNQRMSELGRNLEFIFMFRGI